MLFFCVCATLVVNKDSRGWRGDLSLCCKYSVCGYLTDDNKKCALMFSTQGIVNMVPMTKTTDKSIRRLRADEDCSVVNIHSIQQSTVRPRITETFTRTPTNSGL